MFTEFFDALGKMLGTALLVGGVLIGLPAFGLGFVLGRITKQVPDPPTPVSDPG